MDSGHRTPAAPHSSTTPATRDLSSGWAPTAQACAPSSRRRGGGPTRPSRLTLSHKGRAPTRYTRRWTGSCPARARSKSIARRHLSAGSMVLYDLSTSWMEETNCPLGLCCPLGVLRCRSAFFARRSFTCKSHGTCLVPHQATFACFTSSRSLSSLAWRLRQAM